MASNTTVNSTLPDACSLLGIFAWKESYLTPTTFIMYLITVVLETLMCPFTILLNSLVILAAKRKRYLRKQKTCVLLACLAVTDLLVGAVVLPLVVTSHILRLLGKRLVCIVDKIATETVYIGCGASLFHLAIISGERYVAIKHSLRYETLVTTERLRVAIAFAWAVPVISALGSAILGLAGESVLRNHVIDGAISTSAMLSVLVTVSFSQAALYRESRRHRRHIRAHQVTPAAAREILKKDKAARTTAIVVVSLCACYATQIVQNAVAFTTDGLSKSLVLGSMYAAEVFVFLNSLTNPIIYCVRSKDFRRAFREFFRVGTT